MTLLLSAAAFLLHEFAPVGAFVFLGMLQSAIDHASMPEFVEVRQQAAAARGCHIAFWAKARTTSVDVGDFTLILWSQLAFQVRFVAWKLGQCWER